MYGVRNEHLGDFNTIKVYVGDYILYLSIPVTIWNCKPDQYKVITLFILVTYEIPVQ